MEIVGKLGLYVLVAHLLGLGQAGLYFTALAWGALGGTLARGGLERAAMARIPAELASGDGAEAARVLRIALLGALLGGGVIGGATLLAAQPMAAFMGEAAPASALATVLVLAGALVLAEALSVTAAGILTGLHRNLSAQLTSMALWPMIALAGLLLRPGADLQETLLITIGARLATVLLGLLLIVLARRDFAPRRAGPAVPMPHLLRTALPLLGVEVVQVSLVTMPTLILAALATSPEVGAFSMAMRISVLSWAILITVAGIAAPRMAAQYRLQEWAQLRQTQRAARWASAALTVPVLLLIAGLAPIALGLLGPGFEQGVTALQILCAGQAVNALFACRDTLLANTGHGDDLLRVNLLQLALAAALAATIVPTWGAEGAAAMAGITTAFGALAQSWVARRRLPRAF